jgi:DNA-binding beta-propeller fold protein YncE
MRDLHRARWCSRAVAAAVLLVAGLSSAGLAAAGRPGYGAGRPGYAVGTIPISSIPGGAAVDPATGRAYVVTAGALSVIDGATGTLARVISLGAHSFPQDVAVDAKTDTVYVSIGTPPSVDVINGATSMVTGSISLPFSPGPIELDAGTGTLYAAHINSVAAIDITTGTVTGTINLGRFNLPEYLAADPATGTLYAAGVNSKGTGTVWVLDGSTLTLTRAIELGVGLEGIDVDPATARPRWPGLLPGGRPASGSLSRSSPATAQERRRHRNLQS